MASGRWWRLWILLMIVPAAGWPRAATASEAAPSSWVPPKSRVDLATLLGGDGGDKALAVAITYDGTAFVGGVAGSSDWPAALEGIGETVGSRGFVARISPTGALDWVVPVEEMSRVHSLAVGSGGDVFVTGWSNGSAVVVLDGNDGTVVRRSKFVGNGWKIALDRGGNVYVTGDGPEIARLPRFACVRPYAEDRAFHWMVKLTPELEVVWAMHLGMPGMRVDTAVLPDGSVLVAGAVGEVLPPVTRPTTATMGAGEEAGWFARVAPDCRTYMWSILVPGGVDLRLSKGTELGTWYTGTTEGSVGREGIAWPDLVVGRVSPEGAVQRDVVGGSDIEQSGPVAGFRHGGAFIATLSVSSDFPLVEPWTTRVDAAVVLHVRRDGQVDFSSRLLGAAWVTGISTDGCGRVAMVGIEDGPIDEVNPLQEGFGGGDTDGWIVRVHLPIPSMDADCDGVEDSVDNCPATPNPDRSDLDQDGIGDACDGDRDSDGVNDDEDVCPFTYDPTQPDVDGDGRGDLCDPCPGLWQTAWLDSDGDGLGDDCDADVDGDGVANGADNCVRFVNPEQADQDLDGLGDSCDPCVFDGRNDLDGDGFCADVDPRPIAPDEVWLSPYQYSRDRDADGVPERLDNCPYAANPYQEDENRNGFGDACDGSDSDGDGVRDSRDLCPGRQDCDGDGLGDTEDPCPIDPVGADTCRTYGDADADWDGVWDHVDACPDVRTILIGDPCIEDEDGDGVIDRVDPCPFIPNEGTSIGHPCDPDDDGDGIADEADACPYYPQDDIGDPCDFDEDGDGIRDREDACPFQANDGLGDPCDPDEDDDGVIDGLDLCPFAASPRLGDSCLPDADGDGLPDVEDACPLDPRVDATLDPVGDPCDPDEDRDGVPDVRDACAFDPDDSVGDLCNHDEDGDGMADAEDPCPYGPQDAIGDPCNPDDDGDGIPDGVDACPFRADDAVGDPCVGDEDGDGVLDGEDACPFDANDAVGDPCEHDEDLDGIDDFLDACPTYRNDSVGDPCEPDEDGDGVGDRMDRCPFYPNDAEGDPCAQGGRDGTFGCSATAGPGAPAAPWLVLMLVAVALRGTRQGGAASVERR